MAKTQIMSNWHLKSVDEEDFNEEEDSEYSSDEAENAENFEQQKNELSEQSAESNSIIVKVKRIKSGVNDELSMKIDRDVELRWLMIHYSDKVGIVDMNQYNTKFMFNGARVRETDTPLRLSMLDNDVIYVFDRLQNYVPQKSRVGDFYRTLSIRMHKRRDTFVRVSFTAPLVPQLKRHMFHENAGKCVSTCFLFNGRKLREDDCVATLVPPMEDGDIVDAFDFEESSSSLRIITPINEHLTFVMRFLSGKVIQVNARGNTPLVKVQRKCAESISIEPEKLMLFCDGRRLQIHKTAQEECLFDGCAIDVIMII